MQQRQTETERCRLPQWYEGACQGAAGGRYCLMHARRCDKDNTDQSDERLTNKPLPDELSHLARFPPCAPSFSSPSSRYLLPSPKAETVARQPAQHNGPALHSVGPRGFNQRVRVCAHLYTELMRWKEKKKKKGVAWIVSVSSKQTANETFSSQGPPLDSSVNIALHSLGICGGAAKPGQFFNERERKMNEAIMLKDICF